MTDEAIKYWMLAGFVIGLSGMLIETVKQNLFPDRTRPSFGLVTFNILETIVQFIRICFFSVSIAVQFPSVISGISLETREGFRLLFVTAFPLAFIKYLFKLENIIHLNSPINLNIGPFNITTDSIPKPQTDAEKGKLPGKHTPDFKDHTDDERQENSNFSNPTPETQTLDFIPGLGIKADQAELKRTKREIDQEEGPTLN